MKKTLICFLLFLSSCALLPNGYFEREVRSKYPEMMNKLCGADACLVTRVWYNGDIVYSLYRNPLSPKDSIRKDSIMAMEFLNNLRKFKN